jgi:hypothetical protein
MVQGVAGGHRSRGHETALTEGRTLKGPASTVSTQ